MNTTRNRAKANNEVGTNENSSRTFSNNLKWLKI